MSSTSLPRTPGTLRILRAQLRLSFAPRSTLFLALMLLASYSVAAVGIISFEMVGAPGVCRGYPLLLVSGASWAVATWNDTDAGRRDYFWALPAGRSTLALMRTAAGGFGLIVGLCVLTLVGREIDVLTHAAVQPASTLAWFSLITGPLTLYLLVSATAIVSAFPGRWAIGALIAWTLLRNACRVTSVCGPVVGGRSVLGEVFGLVPAVTDVMRGEFVTAHAASPWSYQLIVAWLAIGVASVGLAARRIRPV